MIRLVSILLAAILLFGAGCTSTDEALSGWNADIIRTANITFPDGKSLTMDGADSSTYLNGDLGWTDPLPNQTGNASKFLTTNGSNLAWGVPATGSGSGAGPDYDAGTLNNYIYGYDNVTGTFFKAAPTIDNVTGLTAALSGKQETLVSATNIKTINGATVLGAGDLVVGGGATLPDQTGNATKYLQTDGANLQWNVPTAALPADGTFTSLYVSNNQTVSGNLTVSGNVTASNLLIDLWNTAYSWGNHALAGYLSSLGVADSAKYATYAGEATSANTSKASNTAVYSTYSGESTTTNQTTIANASYAAYATNAGVSTTTNQTTILNASYAAYATNAGASTTTNQTTILNASLAAYSTNAGVSTTTNQTTIPVALYSVYSGQSTTTNASGGGSWTTSVVASDQVVTNSAVLTTATGLTFNTVANTQYTIRLRIIWNTTSAAADFKYRLTHSGTTTRVLRSRTYSVAAATSATIPTVAIATAFDAADQTLLATAAGSGVIYEDIFLQVNSVGGVVTFQFAQNTATAGQSVTVYEGSYIEYASS